MALLMVRAPLTTSEYGSISKPTCRSMTMPCFSQGEWRITRLFVQQSAQTNPPPPPPPPPKKKKKKKSKVRITVPCQETGGFPSQRASGVESVPCYGIIIMSAIMCGSWGPSSKGLSHNDPTNDNINHIKVSEMHIGFVYMRVQFDIWMMF